MCYVRNENVYEWTRSEIFLRTKCPFRNGTKSIKHVRLSRGEYYQRATITVARQTGTSVLKFITRVLVTCVFDKLVECGVSALRNRRSKNVALQWQRERESRLSGFRLRFYSALLAEKSWVHNSRLSLLNITTTRCATFNYRYRCRRYAFTCWVCAGVAFPRYISMDCAFLHKFTYSLVNEPYRLDCNSNNIQIFLIDWNIQRLLSKIRNWLRNQIFTTIQNILQIKFSYCRKQMDL